MYSHGTSSEGTTNNFYLQGQLYHSYIHQMCVCYTHVALQLRFYSDKDASQYTTLATEMYRISI